MKSRRICTCKMHLFEDGIQRTEFFLIFRLTRNKGLLMFIVHDVIGGSVMELFC